MTTHRPMDVAGATRLSQVALDRVRRLLVTESATQAGRFAAHRATANDLREHTDPDSVLERELAQAGAARAGEAIAEIEHALRRLEAGTYGSCEACGTTIALERLESIPSTRFCVACPGRRPGWSR